MIRKPNQKPGLITDGYPWVDPDKRPGNTLYKRCRDFYWGIRDSGHDEEEWEKKATTEDRRANRRHWRRHYSCGFEDDFQIIPVKHQESELSIPLIMPSMDGYKNLLTGRISDELSEELCRVANMILHEVERPDVEVWGFWLDVYNHKAHRGTGPFEGERLLDEVWTARIAEDRVGESGHRGKEPEGNWENWLTQRLAAKEKHYPAIMATLDQLRSKRDGEWILPGQSFHCPFDGRLEFEWPMAWIRFSGLQTDDPEIREKYRGKLLPVWRPGVKTSWGIAPFLNDEEQRWVSQKAVERLVHDGWGADVQFPIHVVADGEEITFGLPFPEVGLPSEIEDEKEEEEPEDEGMDILEDESDNGEDAADAIEEAEKETPQPWTEKEVEKATDMRQRGKSYGEIGYALTGRSRDAVRKKLESLGIKKGTPA